MNSWCLSVILFFIFFTYTSAAYSEQFIVKNGEIRGTVYGQETGDPLINATVRLAEAERRTLTDENGDFRFEDLPPRRLYGGCDCDRLSPP